MSILANNLLNEAQKSVNIPSRLPASILVPSQHRSWVRRCCSGEEFQIWRFCFGEDVVSQLSIVQSHLFASGCHFSWSLIVDDCVNRIVQDSCSHCIVLDYLNLFEDWGCVWIPYCRAVFEVRSDKWIFDCYAPDSSLYIHVIARDYHYKDCVWSKQKYGLKMFNSTSKFMFLNCLCS